MTQHMFAIYDSAAEQYLAPFPANTPGIAERMFSDMVNTEGHQFNRHPADYTLYRIGTFDTATATLVAVELAAQTNGLQLLHDSTASDSLPIAIGA